MTARTLSQSLFVVALIFALSGGLAAQKKGKPPADIPGSFTMPGPCESPGPGESSGACNDGGETYGDNDGTTVILNANREMRASLYSARFVRLDFSQGVAGTALCGTDCFWEVDDPIIMTDGTVMQTNVVDIGGNEVSGGLMSLQINEQKYARFFFTFRDPSGRDFHWSLRYYPELYPGSDYAHVTRTAECTWTIQSQGGHQGGLIAYGVRNGKDPSSKEGIFVMPFELTFTAPGCTQ